MRINKRLEKAMYNFICTFEYSANYPPTIDFDQVEYAKELEKCVEDKFDYTIEKYGTHPPKNLGRPDVILD